MASYTTSLRLVQPSIGDTNWGPTVNDGLTALVDTAVAGTANILVGSTNYTLSNNNGATDEARSAVLSLQAGTGVGSRIVVVPSLSKLYVVSNATGFAQEISTSTTPGSGISVPNGSTAFLRCDGANVVAAINYFGSLTPALSVDSGGTGATTLTGVLKGNGTSAFTAATAGTDFVAPGTATTFTAKQTFTGTASTLSSKLVNALETVTVSATAATGTINYDVTTQSVLYYTTNASANWTVNFRASSGTSLDTAMATGESVTVAFLVTQGATAYYNNAVQVDGASVTPKWQGGAAPILGNASSIDAYTYTIIKTGAAAFTVLASQTRFA